MPTWRNVDDEEVIVGVNWIDEHDEQHSRSWRIPPGTLFSTEGEATMGSELIFAASEEIIHLKAHSSPSRVDNGS